MTDEAKILEQKGDLIATIQFMGKTKEEFNSFATDIVSKLKLAESDSDKKYFIVVEGTVEGVVKNKINLYNLVKPKFETPENIDQETFDRLVGWLSSEYPKEDAIHQLKEATFQWEGTNFLTITYSNGVQDKLLVEDNKLVHLNNSK